MSSLGSPTESRRWPCRRSGCSQSGQGFVAQVLRTCRPGRCRRAFPLAWRSCSSRERAQPGESAWTGGFVVAGRIRRAFVEDHDDIQVRTCWMRIDSSIRQEEPGAVDGRREFDPLR